MTNRRSPAHDRALVTLTIGEPYRQQWESLFAPGWRAYAARHGYDIVAIDDYIDRTDKGRARTPHWQKCLVLEHPGLRRYRHVVWLDSDIMINPHTAPCIVNATGDTDRIGAVTFAESERPNAERTDNGVRRVWKNNAAAWVRSVSDPGYRRFYALAGYAMDREDMINTGVLVLRQGAAHRRILRHVYDTCEENPASSKEQVGLSHYLLTNDLVRPIDSRFNKIWDTAMTEVYPFLNDPAFARDKKLALLCVNAMFHNCYFMHFIAGSSRGLAGLVQTGMTWPACAAAIRQHFPATG